MMDFELPARIFYDSTIDHRERLRRLEEALAKSSNEEERVNLVQYIGDTHRALEMGIERWRVPDSPEGACDELMRSVLETAAQDLRPDPDRASFLERLLEEAVIDAWTFWSTGGSARPRVKLSVAGWDPEPGGTDLVFGMLGDPQPTIVAELKVLDVDQTLWDLAKVISILEHEPTLLRGYLIVATTPKRWHDAEVAALYGLPGPEAPEGVREWDTRRLFEDWSRSWTYLLQGGRGRPRHLPRGVRTRFIAAHPVAAFPDYELRCIAVEPLTGGLPLSFDEAGWPQVASGHARTYTLKELVHARQDAMRYANAHPDLRDYHRDRATALGRALRVDLDADPPRRDEALLALLRSTEAQLRRTRSPFADFLEAPESVIAVYRQHGLGLKEAAASFEDRLVDLLVTIIARTWSVPPEVAATEEELRANGFDPSAPAPDPLDYL